MSEIFNNRVETMALWIINLSGFLLILLGINKVINIPFLLVWLFLWWTFVLGNGFDGVSFAIFFWPIYVVLFLRPYGTITPVYIDEISLLAFPFYMLPLVILWIGFVLRSLLRHNSFRDVFTFSILVFLTTAMAFEVHNIWKTIILSFGLVLLGYLLAFYWIVLRDNRISKREVFSLYFLGVFLHFLFI